MTWSLPEEPVSLVSATLGAAGSTVSRVKARRPGSRRYRPGRSAAPRRCWSPAPAGRGWGRWCSSCCRRRSSTRPCPGLDADQRQGGNVGDLVGARGARVVGQRHGRRGRVDRIEREGEGGRGRDVAGEVGLAHLDGVRPCTSWASVGALVLQLLPPSSEYSTVAPLSIPVSVSEAIVGDLVAARGAGVVGKRHPRRRRHAVSRVKEKAVSLVLPATSVARTITLLRPSAAVKLLVKVEPPSVL